MTKTVAIVGSHPNTRHDAPFENPDIDIWVFNEAAGQRVRNEDGKPIAWVKRCDAVLQLHTPTIYRSPHNRSDRNHWNWLQEKHPYPVYMQDVDPQVPSSVKYPLDEICDTLLSGFLQGNPPTPTRFFTSSIAYAIALAIYQEYDEIQLYGIEMSSDTEYTYQRACVGFWLALALGRGINVVMNGGDALFDTPLYAYEGNVEHKPEEFKARVDALEKMTQAHRTARHNTDLELSRGWKNGHLSDNVSALLAISIELGKVEGALAEVEKYSYKLDAMWADSGTGMIDRNEFEGAAAKAQQEARALMSEVHRSAGSVDYMMNAWNQTKNPAALKQLKTFVSNHIDAGYKAGQAIGRFEENKRLCIEYDKNTRAAGGQKAIAAVMDAQPAR